MTGERDAPGVGSANGVTVLVRGAGDLATGVAYRLYRAGFAVYLTELPEPRAVRRTVSFSECVFRGETVVEGVRAVRVGSAAEARELLGGSGRTAGGGGGASGGVVPVIVDTEGRALEEIQPAVLVDARMAKRQNLGTTRADAPVVIGVGPGFTAGEDVDAVVETARGHTLGRVIYRGEALPPTGKPGDVGGYTTERVLRTPAAGTFRTFAKIGDCVEAGQVVAEVVAGKEGGGGGPWPLVAQIGGVLRGLLRDGAPVRQGQKAGDVDHRFDPAALYQISDKALAVGGGVLEAVFCLLWGRPPREAVWPRAGGRR